MCFASNPIVAARQHNPGATMSNKRGSIFMQGAKGEDNYNEVENGDNAADTPKKATAAQMATRK